MGKWYEQLEDNKVKCTLCPNYCIIPEGKVGKCRARKNENGAVVPLGYGKISSYALDPIEKKPLRFYHQGSYIFSVGGFGCNFRCPFCQNYRIAQEMPPLIDISVDELVDKVLEIEDNLGIAFTYNEPMINIEFIIDVAKKLRPHGKKIVLVTNGYINPEPFKELVQHVDAMNIDLKAFNGNFYKKYCQGDLESVKEIIKIAAQHVHVELTTLLIEGHNTDMEEIEALAQWVAEIDKDMPLHLSRYFPAYKMKDPQTELDTMLNAQALAKKYLNRVVLGNVPFYLTM